MGGVPGDVVVVDAVLDGVLREMGATVVCCDSPAGTPPDSEPVPEVGPPLK